MTCQHWVDRGHIACESWADEISGSCTSWKDEGSAQCSQWSDEGQNECNRWADEGHNACCDWWPCSWACDAYYWVANVVCVGWYWVANLVCQAWYWAANLVCQVFAWIVKTVCLLASWVAELVCVAWDDGKCLINSIANAKRRRRNPLKHVFVLMLENRAFDHMLGFSGLAGTDAMSGNPRSVDGVIGSPVFNVDPSAPTVPVPPSVEANFKLSKPADDDPGHEFLDTLVALSGATTYNGGPYPAIDNSGFIASYATMNARDSSKLVVSDPTTIMKCYSPKRIRVLSALGAEFAVCDRWFSSMPGPTWPNRFFMHAASSGGLDDSPTGAQSAEATLFDGYRFENGTIFDRLDDSCIEWRIYAGDNFPVSLAISGMTLNELQGRIRDFDEFDEAVSDPGFSPSYIFIEPNYGNDLPPTAEDFTCGDSQHPLDDVTRGEKLIKHVYETIRNSPHWNTSLLLVAYDEHGGFFDHVPPPPAEPPGDPVSDDDNNHHNFDFSQLGVRVPAVVVSPLIPRATIDGTTYDHTSLLATLEELFGLKPLTNRDAKANSLTHLLSLSTPRTDTPATLPDAAVSGLRCDDDAIISAGRPSTSSSALSKSGDRRWYEITVPLSVRGFLEVALLKALAMARGRDKKQIMAEYRAIRTRGEAHEFMHNVALKARALQVRRPGRVRRDVDEDERGKR